MKARFNKILAAATVAAFFTPFLAGNASAHAVAIGWSKGAAAGSVNLFLGSYHSTGDGPSVEGSAHLVGPSGYDTLTTFTTAYATGALPPLLPIENVQFFSGYTLAGMHSWEAVTITGLTDAGTYNYSYSNVGGSLHWAPAGANTSFALTQADIGGGGTNVDNNVPEPASLGLLALGLIGLGYSRRRG